MSRYSLQVCYVLVARGWDRHAQMMWLSVQSLRRHEPRASVTLLTDPATRAALEGDGRRLLDAVDHIVAAESEGDSPRLRAFFLKTAIRRHVTGDVLYLDGDTLVIRPLSDVLDIDSDVAAATDFNHTKPWFPPQLREPFTALEFEYPLPYYFNSGVLLLRDSPSVRAFADEWTRRWRLLSARAGMTDQDAFVSALYASNVRWTMLPAAFNAITVKRNYRFRQARVLHFFGSADEQRGTLMAHLLDHLQRTGEFDERAYTRCLKEGHPWGPGYEPWQLWRSRNYVRAAALKAWQLVARPTP